MYRHFFKRFFDLLLSFIAIVLLSPVLLILTIVGAIAMGGNPFFTQQRPGKKDKNGNEKIFKLIKFRTMSNKKDKDGNLLPDKIRLNKYGMFLRSTSLDELPEIFNILFGQMSIVGPRPLAVEYLDYYTDEERVRHNVRPGLTGLAQVNGRNSISWEDKFAYDIKYVNNISLFLDIKILFLTFVNVIKRKDIGQGNEAPLSLHIERQNKIDCKIKITQKENDMERFKGKKLLVIGGIKYECDIVEHAKKMGIYTIVADYDVDSPAKKIADKAVLIDALDVKALTDFCRKEKVDGVVSGFVDILLPGWKQLCENLNLPCYLTDRMIQMSTDKVVFKETCEEYGIPVPKTYFIGHEPSESILKTIKYPVFVKPLDASGSRGCGVCNSPEELIPLFKDAVTFSKTKNAVIEEYLVGREFLLDYIGCDGDFRLVEMFDRFMADDRTSARNFSNVSLAPSFALDFYYKNIDEKVRKMFKEIGFKDGLIFLQGHSDGDKITFYEMGCRLGGSFFDLEQECLGFNSIDTLIAFALTGRFVDDINTIPMDCARFKKYGAVNNFLLAGGNETIHSIKGIEDIKKHKSYLRSIQYRDEGLYYVKDSIVDKPVISIYFTGNTIDDIRESIGYFNDVFEVTNIEGKSLLMDKVRPEDIKNN